MVVERVRQYFEDPREPSEQEELEVKNTPAGRKDSCLTISRCGCRNSIYLYLSAFLASGEMSLSIKCKLVQRHKQTFMASIIDIGRYTSLHWSSSSANAKRGCFGFGLKLDLSIPYGGTSRLTRPGWPLSYASLPRRS